MASLNYAKMHITFPQNKFLFSFQTTKYDASQVSFIFTNSFYEKFSRPKVTADKLSNLGSNMGTSVLKTAA